MKTLKTIVSSALIAIVLPVTVFATTVKEPATRIEMSSAKTAVKKVILRGNLKVLILQDKYDWVSLDENDQKDVSITQIGNTLTISSAVNNPITLTVYVKDIFRIEAANNANVKTGGNFTVKYLQVILKDSAVASINANTYNIFTSLDGTAKLVLLGKTEKHIVKTKGLAELNTEKFAALLTEKSMLDTEIAMK